ncbi:MAG: DUF72 domain-containing protein [Chloroflexi bacterium]|nr:DUF72 domain-containing protein [Chloroflexota bacterium]
MGLESLFIGTSGWVYPHWRGRFYPRDLPQSCWFEFYTQHFSSVEINNTFYQLPALSTFRAWSRQAPADFRYAVKGNRFITHIKRLKETEGPVKKFLTRVRLLGPTLGPLLWQLPPRWPPQPSRLEEFVKILPANLTHIFEFRDERWVAEDVFGILERRRMGFCIFSHPSLDCPLRTTAPAVYLRFHGSTALYAGRYSREELRRWAERIVAYLHQDREVYVYFNNDAQANAIFNAQELREAVEGLL